jgi:AraC-like DNA-binding protein
MRFMRAAVLGPYPALARELGLNPVAQLREVGLTPAMIARSDDPIRSDAVVRLLESSARQSGCRAFGLRMAESRQMSHFGVTGLLLSHQRTPRDALSAAIRYMHLLNESVALHLEETGRTAVIRGEILTERQMSTTQTTELLLAVYVQLFRVIAGDRWQPRTVYFKHAAPDSLDVHYRVFRCRCEFGAEFNGLSCPVGDLDIVNPSVDPKFADYARQFIDALPGRSSESVVADVSRLVYLLLPTGQANIKHVALSLGMNVRTLQRELDSAGQSFSSLLNGVRRTLVAGYLENPRFTVGHVAALLGYRQHGSFTRWFVEEFDSTPLEWRRAQKAPRRRAR